MFQESTSIIYIEYEKVSLIVYFNRYYTYMKWQQIHIKFDCTYNIFVAEKSLIFQSYHNYHNYTFRSFFFFLKICNFKPIIKTFYILSYNLSFSFFRSISLYFAQFSYNHSCNHFFSSFILF